MLASELKEAVVKYRKERRVSWEGMATEVEKRLQKRLQRSYFCLISLEKTNDNLLYHPTLRCKEPLINLSL